MGALAKRMAPGGTRSGTGGKGIGAMVGGMAKARTRLPIVRKPSLSTALEPGG